MSAWDNPEEMLTRAQTARAQGDNALAYQMYARASEINPQDANAWRGRAETSTNQDEALVSYAYAAALAPADRNLEHTLDASIAQRLTTTTQDDVPLLVAMGQELAEVGLADKAEQFFQRAVALDETSTDALVWLAGLEQDQDKQTAYLNRALATNPRDSRARSGLLALKPPPPPSPVAATTAAIQTPTPVTSAARTNEIVSASEAQTQSSMERLRKLREATPPSQTPTRSAPMPAPQPAPVRPATNTMRYLLLGLLALVVILAFAGIFLMLTQ